MRYPLPLAGSGGIVTGRQWQADQGSFRVCVRIPSKALPPAPIAPRREGSGIVCDPHGHHGRVLNDVVGAVRKGLALG